MINKWHETDIDSAFYLLLQDLTTVLVGDPSFTFVYGHGAVVDIANKEISGSSFWDDLTPEKKEAGYKTDVLLRAVGTMHASNIKVLQRYFKDIKESAIPGFAVQLLTCLEDVRLELFVQEKRPGTKHDFALRTKAMRPFFESQTKVNQIRNRALDELFCLIYLQLYTEEPEPNFKQASSKQIKQLENIRPLLFETYGSTSTQDTVAIAMRIVAMIEATYTEDMQQTYQTFSVMHLEQWTKDNLFDELTRTDPLANEDEEQVDSEKQDVFEQPFSTWHRENENSDRQQNMLQFELDVGTKTDILGNGARETEDGDQAMASVQGHSGKSEQNDFSEQEASTRKTSQKGQTSGTDEYGRANQYAVAKIKEAKTPSNIEKDQYDQMVTSIDPYRRKLARTIEKTLEHKRNAPHKNLLFGRLSKKLLPLAMEENPRVFYKKTNISREIDAAFTLLVDCSYSMEDKMEETKRGITLFHETLTQLRIPHEIIGFWEDTFDGTDTYHPNYFHEVHQFRDNQRHDAGAEIMQLEAEEDNRDGFSIRVVTERLLQRREKHKFLLVFSDGEPAAMHYDQNGIVDTNVAVREARKQGVNVIGMYLANEEISEQEESLMHNIYGKSHVMIPDLSELPERLLPLLKTLILKGI